MVKQWKRWAAKILIGAIFIGAPLYALADYTIKDSGGTTRTILAFVCATTKICPAHVLIKSDGTEIGTTSNPVYIDTPASGNLYGATTGAIPAGTNLIGQVSLNIAAAANSATNGIYSNLLQGNAVISATNGLYFNVLQGNAAISATNGGYANLLQGNAVNSVTNPIFVEQAANADPCSAASVKINVPISTATGTVALVAGVSAKKIYVCSFSIITTTAISVSLSEGSGTTCGTSSQAGVIGVGTNGTAANGLPLAANGGLTLGNGGGTVAATATAANYLCLFQSGTAQIAGNLTYVQQ